MFENSDLNCPKSHKYVSFDWKYFPLLHLFSRYPIWSCKIFIPCLHMIIEISAHFNCFNEYRLPDIWYEQPQHSLLFLMKHNVVWIWRFNWQPYKKVIFDLILFICFSNFFIELTKSFIFPNLFLTKRLQTEKNIKWRWNSIDLLFW